MRKNDIVFIIVLLTVLIYIALYPAELGLPATISDNMIDIIPGIIVALMGFKGYHDSRGINRSLSLILLGVGLALFTGTINTMGLITVEMFNGLTIMQLQTWIIILSTLAAAAHYFTK